MKTTEHQPDEFSPNDIVKFHWDSNAAQWAELVRSGQDTYREHLNNPAFFSFLGDIAGKRVLDLGCGEGYNTRMMARKDAIVTGIDISSEMIRLAKDSEEKEPLKIEYSQASFTGFPHIRDESIDIVVSTMALMDGPDYPGALAETYRVLKHGGVFVFSITHPCFVTKGAEWIKDENGHSVKYTVSDYFSKDSWLDTWTFSKGNIPKDVQPFNVPRFPRTLSDYINPLVKAGFRFEEMLEPRPSEEKTESYPWLKRWREHASLYMYIRASKV